MCAFLCILCNFHVDPNFMDGVVGIEAPFHPPEHLQSSLLADLYCQLLQLICRQQVF